MIGAAAPAIIAQPYASGVPTAFPTATASTPNFSTNLPSAGTVFAFEQSGFQLSALSDGSRTVQASVLDSGVTVTLTSVQTTNGSPNIIAELKIPGLQVDAQNLSSANQITTVPNQRTVGIDIGNLNYTLLAAWTVSPATNGLNSNYLGFGISGYQTPTNGVPASGTGNYDSTGNGGGVVGALLTASAGSLVSSTITGDVNVSVNFATGSISGAFTNMSATQSGGTTSSAWNNVSLTGNLSGPTLAGTTASPLCRQAP